jgi:tRNA(adenine34) deaminase
MKKALGLAAEAARRDEVPIGALLVKNGRILARAANQTKKRKDPTAHAEILVLQKAAKILKNERFLETILYVTKEPCAMCAGAIIQARIPLVVFGARDPKMGACGSALGVIPNRKLNHRPAVIKGVLADESIFLLQDFFRRKR